MQSGIERDVKLDDYVETFRFIIWKLESGVKKGIRNLLVELSNSSNK
jgi:hypothetical protein